MCAALADLPLAALRLPNNIVEILAELGIEQIEQLLAVPRDALAARFDPILLERVDQALGAASEKICSHRPPPEFSSGVRLEFPLAGRAELEHVLAALLHKIGELLTPRQQGAIQLQIELDCEAGEPVQFVVGLYRASANAKHLLELAKLQLDRLRLPGPVIGVRISVLTSAPLANWQQELFDEKSHRENARQVALLVDRLSNRLGRQSVVRAVPLAEAQPEFAFRYEPLAGMATANSSSRVPLALPVFGPKSVVSKSARRNTGRASGTQRKTTASLTLMPQKETTHKPRPLKLEPEPIPLEVVSVVPHGPPIQFHWHGQQQRIARAWGPERIETGWWRGRYVQRDYYRVETTTAARFWLFRRLIDEKWFLHGIFA